MIFEDFWSSIFLGLPFIFITVFTVSEKARYTLKFAIFIVVSGFAATWPVPLMFLRPFHWTNALIPAWQLRKVIKFLGFNYVVRGQENIVKDTAAVVIINHQSSLDLAVLAHIWPVIDNCTVVVKKEVLYAGTFGIASALWGTIFIDRKKHKESQDALNATAEIIKRRKAKLLLFPEGTRHSENELRPFKKGAFHVAISSQIPIQPIVVSKYYFIDDKRRKFTSGKSYITILPAISTEGMTRDDIDTLINKAHGVMNREFQTTTQEVLREVGHTNVE